MRMESIQIHWPVPRLLLMRTTIYNCSQLRIIVLSTGKSPFRGTMMWLNVQGVHDTSTKLNARYCRWTRWTLGVDQYRVSVETWRHQMETFSALLATCAGNSPVPVNSPHKGQWRGALMFSLIGVWINGWVNNREVGDVRRYRVHYDVIVMNSS